MNVCEVEYKQYMWATKVCLAGYTEDVCECVYWEYMYALYVFTVWRQSER